MMGMLGASIVLVGLASLVAGTLVEVQTDKVLFQVDDRYLSFNIDSQEMLPNRRWGSFNFSSPRLVALLTGLSPAILRLGGSLADQLLFDQSPDVLNISGVNPNFVLMTRKDWDNLVAITEKSGLRLLFDLDLQLRYGNGWDPTNAIELFDYCRNQGYGSNIDFELGNEPGSRRSPFLAISGKQGGEDFLQLRNILNKYDNFRSSRFVGPDVVEITGPGGPFLEGMAKIAGQSVDAITFHQYYFRGDIASWKEYLNPGNFKALAGTINMVKKIVARATGNASIPLWIGETSDSWHSGTADVTDRFISGFLWLEKLGLAAKMGISIVMRQTFYGGYYSLMDDNVDPNPDYWVSYVHKMLVGQSVLDVKTWRAVDLLNVRVYAHCTHKRAGYPAGAVTMFALNIDTIQTDVLAFTNEFSNLDVDVYWMTPGDSDGLLSKFIKLNGRTLILSKQLHFPQLKPVRMNAQGGLKLPPLSFGFFVFPHAKLAACV